jgi:histidyl-tRNA synthetase
MGSIGGGGRYDDLTGLFDVPNIPGVGISFGVDRIYDVMEEKNLFPQDIMLSSVKVMLVNFGPQFEPRNIDLLSFLRERGVSCELYPEAIKFDKQLKYANKKHIEYIILIGENELNDGYISMKNFATGEQVQLQQDELLHVLK